MGLINQGSELCQRSHFRRDKYDSIAPYDWNEIDGN